jgi:hypothetical protein
VKIQRTNDLGLIRSFNPLIPNRSAIDAEHQMKWDEYMRMNVQQATTATIS